MTDGNGKLRALAIAALLMAALPLYAATAGADALPALGGFISAITQGLVSQEETYEPLQAALAISNTDMTGAGKCAGTITLSNQGDDVISDVTIYDAARNVLWGPRDMDLGATYVWKGSLDVTDDMLEDGKLECSVQYTLAKGSSRYEKTVEKHLNIELSRVMPQPALEFSRSQSMTYAQPGQRVTLTYTVKNAGNVKLTDVNVTDSLFGTVGTLDELGVDEKKTFTRRVTVGSTALTSQPTARYSYEGSQDIIEKEISSSSIRIAQPSLEVMLESDATLVNPGETIMLRCKLINNGNVGYKKIQLSDQVLGDLGFVDDLKAGKDTVYAKSVRIQSKTTFKFTITAKDTTGSDVTAISNSLTIDVVSRSDAPSLTLSAQADKIAVANGAPVTFTLVLCNNGTSDIKNIEINERNHGSVARVEMLRAGESMPITAQYTVTGYEIFTFMATMTQQDGATREALAEPITISMGSATPQPSPSHSPAPAPAVTIAPGLLKAYDEMFNRVMTYVLAAAVCLIIVLVVVFSVNRANDNKRQKLAAHRRRVRHKPNDAPLKSLQGMKEKTEHKPQPEDDVKVYIPSRKLKRDEQHRANECEPVTNKQNKHGRHDKK